MGVSELFAKIDSYRDEVIALQRELVAISALSPDYEAAPEQTGETRKVEFLKSYLRARGISDLTEINAPDERVPGGVRPTLIARVKGRRPDGAVWVMSHTDVVPPGDLDKWSSDPFELRVDGDTLYGRGTEDDHQGIVSGIMAALALVETGTVPERDLNLLFVADEECGSAYGISYVLDKANPFKPGDIIVVPDSGVPDGSEIEVAEKSIIWFKLTVTGVQCHASTPQKGNNAMRAGAHLVVALDGLKQAFDLQDPVFSPPCSTFEPTKKEPNVPNVNTIPGEDVFYFDCRILPPYRLEEIETKVREICDRIADEHNVTVDLNVEQRMEAAPVTPTDAPVVRLITAALKEVYGVDGRPIGIGGGTVAAHLRKDGLPCAVWSKMDETLHGPNENAKISNILGDAKVFAHIALAG